MEILARRFPHAHVSLLYKASQQFLGRVVGLSTVRIASRENAGPQRSRGLKDVRFLARRVSGHDRRARTRAPATFPIPCKADLSNGHHVEEQPLLRQGTNPYRTHNAALVASAARREVAAPIHCIYNESAMFDWGRNNLRKIRSHRIKPEETEQGPVERSDSDL